MNRSEYKCTIAAAIAAMDEEEQELREEKAALEAKEPKPWHKKVIKDINHKLIVLSRTRSQMPTPEPWRSKPVGGIALDCSGFFEVRT